MFRNSVEFLKCIKLMFSSLIDTAEGWVNRQVGKMSIRLLTVETSARKLFLASTAHVIIHWFQQTYRRELKEGRKERGRDGRREGEDYKYLNELMLILE